MSKRHPVLMMGIPLPRARRNPPKNDVVDTQDLIDIAKDRIKLGDFSFAAHLLAEEAKMSEQNIASVFFSAVSDELASGKRAVAKKLFTPIRKLYRDFELPSRLHSFVTFNAKNAAVDLAIALGEDRNDVAERIEPVELGGLSGFEVAFGRREYQIAKNDDAATAIAITYVTDNLNDDPGVYGVEFVSQFANQEKLKELVREMALDNDYWNEADEKDVVRAAQQYRLYYDTEEDDDGDEQVKDMDNLRDEVAEAQADERAKDPIAYLEEMMTPEGISQWIIDNVGIDIEQAAEALVNEAGAGQYLGSYDGNLSDTVSGFTYWRTN